jgi:hypothetical protein
MTALRELLDDLADEAKLYDVTDRAMAVARRRRQLQRMVPVAVAAGVLLATGAAVALPRHHARPTPATSAAGSGLAWLPARINAVADPPVLPSGAVGRGALLYDRYNAAAKRRDMVLVTTTGHQYRLPEAGGSFVPELKSPLSPDGRWLVYTNLRTAYLRDLTGTKLLTLPAGGGIVWSPDGHWLAVEGAAGNAPQAPHAVTRVDLRTGTLRTYKVACCYAALAVDGIHNDGRLEYLSSNTQTTAKTYDVYNVDPVTSQSKHSTLTLPVRLSPGAPGAGWNGMIVARVAAGATRLLFLNGGILTVVDLTTTRVVGTHQVPRSGPAHTDTSRDDIWFLGGQVPQGVLLVHQWFANGQTQRSIELLDLDTDTHRPISLLPPDIIGVVPLRG